MSNQVARLLLTSRCIIVSRATTFNSNIPICLQPTYIFGKEVKVIPGTVNIKSMTCSVVAVYY